MSRIDAQSFATAFGCFGVFAAAYFGLEAVIPLKLQHDMPVSLAELSTYSVMLIFVVFNMIMLIRAATIRNLDYVRSIYLALAILGIAGTATLAARAIDRYFVFPVMVVDDQSARQLIIIRPLVVSDSFFITVSGEAAPATLDAQERVIVADIEAQWDSHGAERYAEIIGGNGVVASVYALAIILSRALLLCGLSLLSWILILKQTRSRSRRRRGVGASSPPVSD